MHFSHVTLSSSLTVLDRNAGAEECVLLTFNVAKSPSRVMQLCLFIHPETAGMKLVSLATWRCYSWYLNCSSLSCGTGWMHLEKIARKIPDTQHINWLHRPLWIFLILCCPPLSDSRNAMQNQSSSDISCSEKCLASCNCVSSSTQKQLEWS